MTPTTAPVPPLSPGGLPKYIPCSADSVISFSAGRPGTETVANIYDTAETIAEIRRHNAAVMAACGK